jgi:hypothetical protein
MQVQPSNVQGDALWRAKFGMCSIRSCTPHNVPDHYQASALCLGLQAVSPHYLFTYLARNGRTGWESLAGALLAFTGVARCWLAASKLHVADFIC